MTKANKPGSEKDMKAPVAISGTRSFQRRDNKAESSSKQNPPRQESARPRSERAFGATITRRAADRLRAGHVWVYASDVESLNAGEGQPSLLPVADQRGLLLGTALHSPTSQIALRLVSRDAIDEKQWIDLLAHRLRAAIQRRMPMLTPETDACRLCFSEADELPGLIIDKYGDLIILQLLVNGLDSPAVRQICVDVLRSELDPSAIVERPDPRVRELEGLSAPGSEALYLRVDATSADRDSNSVLTAQFLLNGLRFFYDANSGQKTGAFLDQRMNYAAARDWARKLGATGRALDVCTYQGGFALHLAEVCQTITGLDASHASLEVAERNLATNRAHLKAEVDWLEGDAFQVLRDCAAGREQFDTIVLDPPAFAKSKRAVEGALRGYKELNLRAMQMLRPHGLLVTCSCSHHVPLAAFEAIVAAAAADAHRRVILHERRGAAPDHPVILNIPETEYLKCLILEVE